MTVTFNLTLKLLVSVVLGHNNSRKETESYRLVFPASTKREIRHFHSVVEQRRFRNVQKNLMHVQSCCFANLNLLLFCRFRCRRRCLSSLISEHWDRTQSTQWHTDEYGFSTRDFASAIGTKWNIWHRRHWRLTQSSRVRALASGALLYFRLRLISLTDLNAFLSTWNSFAI